MMVAEEFAPAMVADKADDQLANLAQAYMIRRSSETEARPHITKPLMGG